MVRIDRRDKSYIVVFKRKDLRPNSRDDKFEIFRHAIGLQDTNNILDIYKDYTGHHKTTPIRKNRTTISDVNSYDSPIISARLTDEQVIRLRKDPNIELVVESPQVHMSAQTVDWGTRYVRAPQAHNPSTYNEKGDGAIIAITDTGIQRTHEDIGISRVPVQQSFLESDTTPTDVRGHGTHCAGIAAASDNTVGVLGVAPNATLWNLRMLNANGASEGASPEDALTFAFANNAHVVSASWGHIDDSDAAVAGMKMSFERFTRPAFDNKAILFCTAMGNDSMLTERTFPSYLYGALGVSSLTLQGRLSSFTNWGSSTDFCAPGGEHPAGQFGILSTYPPNTYARQVGTSMACPQVAGLCALAVASYKESQCPPYDPLVKKGQTLVTALRMSASQPDGRFAKGQHNNFYGYGFPEADRLVSILRGEALG